MYHYVSLCVLMCMASRNTIEFSTTFVKPPAKVSRRPEDVASTDRKGTDPQFSCDDGGCHGGCHGATQELVGFYVFV